MATWGSLRPSPRRVGTYHLRKCSLGDLSCVSLEVFSSSENVICTLHNNLPEPEVLLTNVDIIVRVYKSSTVTNLRVDAT